MKELIQKELLSVPFILIFTIWSSLYYTETKDVASVFMKWQTVSFWRKNVFTYIEQRWISITDDVQELAEEETGQKIH